MLPWRKKERSRDEAIQLKLVQPAHGRDEGHSLDDEKVSPTFPASNASETEDSSSHKRLNDCRMRQRSATSSESDGKGSGATLLPLSLRGY